MPPDPKKPIEELLEASAQARRAEFGAAPEMPNPMRARLHDEVAHLNREKQPRERRSWLAVLWPQISIATAVAAVLVTAGVLWLGHRSDSGNENVQLAMRAPASAQPEAALKSLDAANEVVAQSKSTPDEASELTLPAAASVAGSLADNTTATQPPDTDGRTDGGATALQKFGEVAIPPAAPAEPVYAEKAKELEARPRDAVQAPVVAANAPQKNLADADAAGGSSFRNQKTETANFQQRFSQTARGQALRSNAKLKQAANVLNTFQVEQNGREIRLVDEDGSTYTGKLEAAGPDAARSRAEAKTTAAAPPAARSAVMREKDSSATENELYFRAVGYNASLKKQVVFEGNYIAPPPVTGQKSASDLKKDEQAPARIVGKAKVPGEAPVEVDAIAITR